MSSADILPLVRRLDRKYRKRFSDGDCHNEADELDKILHRFDLITIEKAVDRVIEREPHYPTPRKILDAVGEVLEFEARRRPATETRDSCSDCGSRFTTRYWWRRPRNDRDVSDAMAPNNPHKGFVLLGGRLHCDCSWRKMIKLYLTNEELAVLFLEDDQDPIVLAEIRFRGSPAPKKRQLALMVEGVGKSIDRGDAFEEPPSPTGDDVRADLSWSDEQPLASVSAT